MRNRRDLFEIHRLKKLKENYQNHKKNLTEKSRISQRDFWLRKIGDSQCPKEKYYQFFYFVYEPSLRSLWDSPSRKIKKISSIFFEIYKNSQGDLKEISLFFLGGESHWVGWWRCLHGVSRLITIQITFDIFLESVYFKYWTWLVLQLS